MPDSEGQETGTVGTFNFIRRIGFPSTIEVSSIFLTIILFSSAIALPIFRLGLQTVLTVSLFVIILPTVLGELLAANLVLRDNVLTFRRLMGMELLAWAPSLVLFPLAALIALFDQALAWEDSILLVLAMSLPIRFLSIISLAGSKNSLRVLASILVPALVGVGLLVFAPFALTTIFLDLVIVSVLSSLGVVRLVGEIDSKGTEEVGEPPMRLFRGFLEHWLNRDPEILETSLAVLGLIDTIRTSIIAFFNRNKRHKGSLVISSFHPGPYRDLGSGGLPSQLKTFLEASFGGVVHVPHGISGHQSNIITRADIQKFLQDVKDHYPSTLSTVVASSLTRSESGAAKASAQVFDRTAFVTLTMSPVDMEDMPLELGQRISEDARKEGLSAAIVDAHNSMRAETVVTAEQSVELSEAAREALRRAKVAEQLGFKAGLAKDELVEFSLEDGIGPGGLSVLVVDLQTQRVAYLTIDGNNMEPGFRDEILSSLRELGVTDGEVMTTDTHLVTGLVRSPLGYFPVGARLDNTLLLRRITETVARAIADLEDSMVGISSTSVEVTVLGKQTFQSVTRYIGDVGRQVRNLFYLLEAASVIITMAVLVLA